MADRSLPMAAADDAFERRSWIEACAAFRDADGAGELDAQHLSRYAEAAWWVGDVDLALAAGARAYRAFIQADAELRAADSAVGNAVNLFLRGDEVEGSGWLARAQRLLRGHPDSREMAYLRYLTEVEGAIGAIASADSPEFDQLVAAARDVHGRGRDDHDAALATAGVIGEARALIKVARVREGMALLDEAMVAVANEDLPPEWTGNFYCHAIAACYELGDLSRAAAWTETTLRWLESMPAGGVFTGICRVHRSQLLQLSGEWEQAEAEASSVCVEAEGVHLASAAEGHYQLGELLRLRGNLGAAEAEYSKAHQRGRDPQPGMALLRLAQGRVDAAASSIRVALTGERDRLVRFRLLIAQADIALAAGDRDGATAAASEAGAIAEAFGTAGLRAAAAATHGAVLVATDGPAAGIGVLRDAARQWQALNAPYEAARVGVQIAQACDRLGDADTAERERSAALATFQRIGATVDAGSLRAEAGGAGPPDGLSSREVEVLALVAEGHTNRRVAAELVISEKTVARHLSNIFIKLGLSSRTAAAAYAFEHGLAPSKR